MGKPGRGLVSREGPPRVQNFLRWTPCFGHVCQNLERFTEVWQPSRTVFGRHLCAWLLAAALVGAPAAALAREGRQVHVVYAGQRLGSIAKRYNVSIEAICQANSIQRRDPIRPGQRLEIPSRAEARAMAEGKTKSATPSTQGVVDANTAIPAAKATSRAAAPSTAAAPKATKTTKPPESRDISSGKLSQAVNTTPLRKVVEADKSLVGKPSAVSKPAADGLTAVAVDPITLGPALSGVSHRVRPGESLSAIAVRYDTNVKTLLQVNNLRRDQVIRVGQVLAIPRAAANGSWWAKFARAPRRAGEIEVFAHHAHSSRWKGKIVVNGKVQPAARAALSRLLGATGAAPPVPERLLQLLSHVSDTFGGRPIRLVSGYRTSSYVKDSRHRHSSAVDFSIPGVPNSAVRDYLLQLGNVGVGYYPNSSFVHLDVRARSAYWVDYAGPGEAPRKNPHGDTRLALDTRKVKRKSTAHTRWRRTVRSEVPVAADLNRLAERQGPSLDGNPSVTASVSDSLGIATEPTRAGETDGAAPAADARDTANTAGGPSSNDTAHSPETPSPRDSGNPATTPNSRDTTHPPAGTHTPGGPTLSARAERS